jgi:hypothetical protein
MAKLPPVHILAPTIVRYTFRHQIAGSKPADNVMDVSIDSEPTSARDTQVDIMNGVMCQLWQDHVVKWGSTTVFFMGAHWIDLNSLSGRTGDLAPHSGSPTNGTSAGPCASRAVSHLIHKLSTTARSQRQGRTYYPGVREGDIDESGNLSAGQVASMTSNFENFRTAISDQLSELEGTAALRTVHVHKANPLDPTTWVWTSSTVNACVCDPMVGTQRQRQR